MTSERPLGEELDWRPVDPPDGVALEGGGVRLESLDPVTHGDSLYDAGREARLWDYLPYGPFGERGLRRLPEAHGLQSEPGSRPGSTL